MKLKKIKTIAILSAITATTIIVPTIAITNIYNNNNAKIINNELAQNNSSNLINNNEFNTTLQSSQINENKFDYSNTIQDVTTSRYNPKDREIPRKNVKSISYIANNMTITVPKGLTVAEWRLLAYQQYGISGTLRGAQIDNSGNVGGLQFLLYGKPWSDAPFITWSYWPDMSTTSFVTPQGLGPNHIYIRVFPSGSNAWFGVRVEGFTPSYNGTTSRYNSSENLPNKNINEAINIINNLSILVPAGLTIDEWKEAAYKQGINGTLRPNHINANGNIGGISFLLKHGSWWREPLTDQPIIDWAYTPEMLPTSVQTRVPFGQRFIYFRIFPTGTNAWFGIKVSGFAPSFPGRVSKYNASLSLPSLNIDKITDLTKKISIVVPEGLTIDAWKQAAYRQGINGTVYDQRISSSGNIGGIQFLLQNNAWNGEPYITWSYNVNMPLTSVATPEPFGQDFIYIRVFPLIFPFGSTAWFQIKVTGFTPSHPGTISRYNASYNLPSQNINDIPISNNISVVVPKGLTIDAWKQAAYKQGINGTIQGGNIPSNGNIGGIQFLLNDKETWTGQPFITWSYFPNMFPTTIESSKLVRGQNFIYIRIFPYNSDAWFQIQVSGFKAIFSL